MDMWVFSRPDMAAMWRPCHCNQIMHNSMTKFIYLESRLDFLFSLLRRLE